MPNSLMHLFVLQDRSLDFHALCALYAVTGIFYAISFVLNECFPMKEFLILGLSTIFCLA